MEKIIVNLTLINQTLVYSEYIKLLKGRFSLDKITVLANL